MLSLFFYRLCKNWMNEFLYTQSERLAADVGGKQMLQNWKKAKFPEVGGASTLKLKEEAQCVSCLV